MLRPIFFMLLVMLFLANCQTHTHFVKSELKNNEIKDFQGEDTSVANLIAPYKTGVDKEMNSVIGQTAKMLTKEQPESTLGNWMTDLVHKKSEDYSKLKIDFAILNQGGIRIPSLNEGNITKGTIFELMPFDNLLVLIEVKGKDLPDLFNHIAEKGGWPISKQVKMTIQNNKAIDVRINDKKIENEQTYTFATSDYIANGGDNCSFLINKKQIATGVVLRNAILEFIEEETKAGRKLDANLESRVFILK